MRLAAISLLSISAVSFALPPAATAGPAQDEEDEVPLEYITVTATRMERDLRDLPGTVSVITREQFERNVARDIRDLVRYEPGVSVSGTGRFGLSGFTIRGIGGDRVLTQVDGVRAADEFSFGPFLQARRDFVDIDALKSVEIIRGPASSLYGSDALGGVVSFITKDPVDYLAGTRKPWYLSAKAGGSSEDAGFFTTGTAAGAAGRLSGMVVYTYRNGHETETHGGPGGTGAARAEADPLDYTLHNVLGKVVFDLNDSHQLGVTVERFESDVDSNILSDVGTVVSGALNQTSTGDDSRERLRVSLHYDYDGETPLFDRTLWRVHWQDSETVQITEQQRLAAGVEQFRTRHSRFDQESAGLDVQFEKSLHLGPTEHQVVYGGEYLFTDSESLRDGGSVVLATGAPVFEFSPLPTRDFPLSETQKYAVFLQDEISFFNDRLRITPGVRYDRYELDPEVDALYQNGNPGAPDPVDFSSDEVSFKVGLLFRVTDLVSVYGQFAQGFRAPPYDDINVGFTNVLGGYTTLPNPDLEAETSDGYEAGIRFEGRYGRLSFAAFYNDYDNFIESQAVRGFNFQTGLIEFQSVNRERAVIKGLEGRAIWNVGESLPTLEGLRLYATAAWSHGEDKATDRPLNSIDPLKGVLGLAWQPVNAPWYAELVVTGVASKNRIDHSTATTRFFAPDGYATVDLLCGYRFSERAIVNVGVFNLTDAKYWEWGDVIGREEGDPALARFTRPGINASASFRYEF